MFGVDSPRAGPGVVRRAWAAALLLAAAPAALAQLPAETGAGSLFFRTSPVEYSPATRLATDVDIDVTGIVARVSVEQRFRNDSDEWVEGAYVFPLPDDAAVDGLVMRIGERRIEGEIAEREQARQTYEAAREGGRHASLVEQERPNLFTTSVANIAPGQEIVIEIAYVETVAYDDGRFSLRFPMTLTPRYVPGAPLDTATGAGFAFDTARVPDASRITPPVLDPASGAANRASVNVRIDAGLPLTAVVSPSHDVLVNRDAGTRAYRLSAAEVVMDRDLRVEWRPAAGREPRAVAFAEAGADESHVLLMFVPPDSAELERAGPRELVLVVDTSGSMGGRSIRQAKSALRTALDRLTSRDRFNVIEFNSTARALYPEPVQLTARKRTEARAFVDRLHATGGTNMAPAIRAALEQPHGDGRLRQIVFVTDGSVGNEAELFATIERRLGRARLFTVGIGSAPNSHFMRKAAQFGRGTYTHVSRIEDVAPRMHALFDKLEHAALTGIELDWPEPVEQHPERVPDLYRGEPVIVAARLDRTIVEPIELESSGRVGRLEWSQRIEVEPGVSPGIAKLWARRRIESLLDSRLEGVSETEIRPAVVDVALAHGLLSPYTSLVAVDRTPARSREAALRREAVANMLPAGAEIGAIFGPLPQTATPAGLARLAGIVLAALALALLAIGRMLRDRNG